MNWKEGVLGCFSGLSERDRSNWGGYGKFLNLYNSTFGTDRNDLIIAIGEILNESNDEEIVAVLLHLASLLRIIGLRPYVERFQSSRRFAENTIVKEMLEYYNTVCPTKS